MKWLLRPERPLWRRALLYTPIALLPSGALIALVASAFIALGVDVQPFMRQDEGTSALGAFGTVLVAPLVETLLLAGLLHLLALASHNRVFIATISALAWGCLHALYGQLAFFGTVWGFFVFSCAYIAWSQISFWHGYAAAFIPHAVANACMLTFGAFVDQVT